MSEKKRKFKVGDRVVHRISLEQFIVVSLDTGFDEKSMLCRGYNEEEMKYFSQEFVEEELSSLKKFKEEKNED